MKTVTATTDRHITNIITHTAGLYGSERGHREKDREKIKIISSIYFCFILFTWFVHNRAEINTKRVFQKAGYVTYRGGLNDLGALSKFQVQGSNTITICFLTPKPYFAH